MARRASSRLHPAWVIGAVILTALAIGGGQFLFKGASDPFRAIPRLDTEAFRENSNSLRGNVYRVNGTVVHMLSWSPVLGRLFSLEVESPRGDRIIPVLVPTEFNHVNIQKGQSFVFRIEVDENGVPKVRDLKKV